MYFAWFHLCSSVLIYVIYTLIYLECSTVLVYDIVQNYGNCNKHVNLTLLNNTQILSVISLIIKKTINL